MKDKYIIECTTANDAEKLFRAFEMIGIDFFSTVFNPRNNYCWDIHRAKTLYKILEKDVVSFGVKESYKRELDWLDYNYVDVNTFIKENVKWYHRLKYWFKKKIEML